jgi:class 3 adenylate cyclase
MNYRLLDEKIGDTRTLPECAGSGIDDDTLSAFSHALEGLRGWELVRINPLDFAERFGFDRDEAVSLFILGAKAGLFVFEWNLLCPRCGGREHSYGSLNQLDKEVYHCSLCDADVTVEADDRLEVSFSMPPAVSGEWPDPYVSLSEYCSYFFSSSLVRSTELDDAFAFTSGGRQPPLRFAAVPPGKKTRIRLGVTPARRHRLVSLDTHSIFTVWMKDDPDRPPAEIALAHTDAGFNRKEAFAPLAGAEVVLANRSRRVMGCLVGSPDSGTLQAVIAAHPPPFKPFCSGKLMLNNQLFRDLFLGDDLPDNLSLKINDLTLLFTDLKGSTALSDRRGDVDAYKLVQRHFALLAGIVREHRGGIVKTMGDAVMASFNVPVDGTRAAERMLEAADDFNRSGDAGAGIGLKIGLHRGAAVAVKANGALDYFGQTVNIASRVQGLAGAGEIWITDDVMRDEAAAAHLRAAGFSAVAKDVALKGVGNTIRVHSCKK